jgi:Ser/Thr protein kinase RdoA (MazF antagonist)
VKLYQPWVSERTARSEQARTLAAVTAGVPVPAVGAVVRLDDRWGLVLQHIDGASMMSRLLQCQDDIEASARQLALLHHSLLDRAAPAALPDQAAMLHDRLAHSTALTATERRAALAALDGLPPGDRLCHGDLHPGNVLLASQGPVIIDWMDASRGAAAADIARTLLLFDGSMATGGIPELALANMQAYRRAYIDTLATRAPDVARTWTAWTGVLAAARLDERVPEQHPWLRQCLHRALGLGGVDARRQPVPPGPNRHEDPQAAQPSRQPHHG